MTCPCGDPGPCRSPDCRWAEGLGTSFPWAPKPAPKVEQRCITPDEADKIELYLAKILGWKLGDPRPESLPSLDAIAKDPRRCIDNALAVSNLAPYFRWLEAQREAMAQKGW